MRSVLFTIVLLIGYGVLGIGPREIQQGAITLSAFVPFSRLNLKEPLTLDYLWAEPCLSGAAFFMLRARI